MVRWLFGVTLDSANGDADDHKAARRLIVLIVLVVLSLLAGTTIWHWYDAPPWTPIGNGEHHVEVQP
jgi:hypothetical protein